MLTLVFGGSGSGKSSFAEDLAVTQGDVPRFYIATMQKDGSAEEQQRIEKHRKHRSGKGFETLEWERDLSGHLKRWKDEHTPCVFLLEDLGNLIANEMFSPGRGIVRRIDGGPAGDHKQNHRIAFAGIAQKRTLRFRGVRHPG